MVVMAQQSFWGNYPNMEIIQEAGFYCMCNYEKKKKTNVGWCVCSFRACWWHTGVLLVCFCCIACWYLLGVARKQGEVVKLLNLNSLVSHSTTLTSLESEGMFPCVTFMTTFIIKFWYLFKNFTFGFRTSCTCVPRSNWPRTASDCFFCVCVAYKGDFFSPTQPPTHYSARAVSAFKLALHSIAFLQDVELDIRDQSIVNKQQTFTRVMLSCSL